MSFDDNDNTTVPNNKVETVQVTKHSSNDNSSEDSGGAGGDSSLKQQASLSVKWTNLINTLRVPVLKALHWITNKSACNPKITITIVTLFSFAILVIGLFTGFSVDVEEDTLWTPKGSHPIRHMEWIDDESGFPETPRFFTMVFHENGNEQILGKKQVEQIFVAVDTVRNIDGFNDVCNDCPISGVIKFWNNSATIFNDQVNNDEEAIIDMSVLTFPDDNTPVSITTILGYPVRDEETDLLVSAQNYIVSFGLDRNEDDDESITQDFETKALDAIIDLGEKWEKDGSSLHVEVIAERSFPDEFERAIVNDIPLIPIVFVVMGVFTSCIFYKKDIVKSRSFLGFTAVVSVLLSIMAGFGLMFTCSVPFTSMTQLLPFVFFGVGLDDAFIITGAFFRLDSKKNIEERIQETIDEIGLSIFLTTFTSSLAFGLGALSAIPAVAWLCIYAVPTIIFILLWQLTFFISCLVLDERRIQANNRDWFRCFTCRKTTQDENDTTSSGPQDSRIDRFMESYGEKLLKPYTKVFVILSFIAITAACSVSTSQLEQSFKFTDVLPSDSYITPFFDAFNDYSARSSLVPAAYFRWVDQSDASIQNQMEDYINDLVTTKQILDQPEFFWLRDFKVFVADNDDVANLDFNSQVDTFLSDPVYNELYGDHIVRDRAGTITASRCIIRMDNVDVENVKEQIEALEDQRAITEAQPINEGQSDFRFFLYEGTFNIWEFYAVSAEEIALTTILGVAAVTGIALLFVPHWTAAIFVFPLISILYIDLLGVMQWAGVSINPVSYISLVMSIGLFVDFLLHVLLRYYEVPGNRHEKSVRMMKSMGSSILIGAITTFLGTLPLAFSSSDIFSTVFVAFVGLVSLGATHGLILLPVILGTIGTEEQIALKCTKKSLSIYVKKENKDNNKSDLPSIQEEAAVEDKENDLVSIDLQSPDSDEEQV